MTTLGPAWRTPAGGWAAPPPPPPPSPPAPPASLLRPYSLTGCGGSLSLRGRPRRVGPAADRLLTYRKRRSAGATPRAVSTSRAVAPPFTAWNSRRLLAAISPA